MPPLARPEGELPDPHPIRGLFDRLERLQYPPSVTATWALVEGPEFFPGGCGLWRAEKGQPWPPAPIGGVVVLGHNLDSVDSYRRNLETGGLRRGPTWSNLKRLLDAAEVDPDVCFLTNFFMGCGPEQTGTFPGARDGAFVRDCAELLRETVRLLRPRALLVLGRHTWRHLGEFAPELSVWAGVSSFQDLDARGLAVVPNVRVEGAAPFGAAAVVHPSGATMGGNQGKRRYRGDEGLQAEARALRDALDGPADTDSESDHPKQRGYRPVSPHLSAPSPDDFLATFGVEPHEARPRDGFWSYRLPGPVGAVLTLSFDVHERSVQTRWTVGDHVLSTAVHERATRIVIDERTIRAEFEGRDSRTTLLVQVHPELCVTWTSLACG